LTSFGAAFTPGTTGAFWAGPFALALDAISLYTQVKLSCRNHETAQVLLQLRHGKTWEKAMH
jgi:hypothetical protein